MKIPVFALIAALVALLPAAVPDRSQPRKLKVYISVDMEGVAGAVTGEQLGPTGFEYARFRVRFRAKDMSEASAIMNFIGEYRPDLMP